MTKLVSGGRGQRRGEMGAEYSTHFSERPQGYLQPVCRTMRDVIEYNTFSGADADKQ